MNKLKHHFLTQKLSKMKNSITVSEVEIDFKILDKIIITGAANQEEALQAAEEWCCENNCLLRSNKLEKSPAVLQGSSIIYFAKVISDDYD